MLVVLGLPGGAAAGDWCSLNPLPPCVESAARNGAPVTATDPSWDVFARTDGADVVWEVTRKPPSDDFRDLGAAATTDVWDLVIEIGPLFPRLVFMRGEPRSSGLSIGGGANAVVLSANPVASLGSCDTSAWPWGCDEVATIDRDAVLNGRVTEWGSVTDPARREALVGMRFATNAGAAAATPSIAADPGSGEQMLVFELGSPRFHDDGVTVFRGFADLAIPKAFLALVLGIDQPSTLTEAGVVVAVGGPREGSGIVDVSIGVEDVFARVSELSFSARRIRVRRGVIVPARPRMVSAKRKTKLLGELRFERAPARGSAIERHQALCRAGKRQKPRRSRGGAPSVAVRKLTPGVAYRCRVRAISKAGPGRWSKRVRIPARP